MLLPKIWIICRVCLKQHEQMFNIFDDKTEEQNIWSLLRDCGGVPVRKNDDLPDKICEACLRSLWKANVFRKDCQRGHRELVQMLMERKINMHELVLEEENKYCCSEIISLSESNNSYPISNPTKAPPSEISTNCNTHNEDTIKVTTTNDHRDTLQTNAKQYCIISKDANKLENISQPMDRKEPIVILLKLKNLPHIENPRTKSSKNPIFPKETIRKLKTKNQITAKDPKTTRNTKTVNKQNVKKELKAEKTKLKENSAGSKMAGNHLKAKAFKTQKTVKVKTKFSCKICKKSFNSNVLLKHHAYIHVKPYECKICKKRFSQTHSYLSHTNHHTGIKPYYCRFCYKAFADISNRNSHERKMHVMEKYKCEICNKIFRFLFLLQKHVQCHRPKKCLICDKEFASHQMVRLHHQYAHLKLLKNKS